MRRGAFLSLLLLGAAGCGGCEPPAQLEAQCRVDRDCAEGFACVEGVCYAAPDPRFALDAGAADDGRSWALLDAAPSSDAGSQEDDAAPDAELDAGQADSRVEVDAAVPDAAPGADAGAGDALPDGGSSPPARGSYDYRRILTPDLPPTSELAVLALSPAEELLLVGARYDRYVLLDLASETSSGSVALPKDAVEPLRVAAAAFDPAGRFAVLLATAILGGGVEGRLYRLGPRGQSPALLGRFPGLTFQALAVEPQSGRISALGQRQVGATYYSRILRYDDAQRALVEPAEHAGAVGAEDLVCADDGVLGSARFIAGGAAGSLLGHLDAAGAFSLAPPAGNVAHLAARPGGDEVLAVSWSAGRLLRFTQGAWTTGAAAADFGSTSVWDAAYSSDGARALIVGEYEPGAGRAVVFEYRHGLYSSGELSDVSIGGFNLAPWTGQGGVFLNDVRWRAAGDCGFIAGGCSAAGCMRGYLIRFELRGGRLCP